MELFWFIPTHGDGRYLGTSEGARAVSYAYCKQIAQAADELGFGGVLLPTGKSCEDSWVVASTLVPATRKLKFLVAARPGLIAPTMAARMAATLDRFSEGRLLINVVAGGDPDVYLTWGEPPAQAAEKIARMRRLAEEKGRTLKFGIRLHVIVRETEEEAWRAADELIARLDDETIASAQRIFARMDSVGQRRMSELHKGDRSQLEISPNLWAGIGLVRGGAGTALVGSADNVAARIREYGDLGIETFILSGYPHLEEAYRTAELLFPRLPLRREDDQNARAFISPFGEMIANNKIPHRRRSGSDKGASQSVSPASQS